jgi:hypothetical protein
MVPPARTPAGARGGGRGPPPPRHGAGRLLAARGPRRTLLSGRHGGAAAGPPLPHLRRMSSTSGSTTARSSTRGRSSPSSLSFGGDLGAPSPAVVASVAGASSSLLSFSLCARPASSWASAATARRWRTDATASCGGLGGWLGWRVSAWARLHVRAPRPNGKTPDLASPRPNATMPSPLPPPAAAKKTANGDVTRHRVPSRSFYRHQCGQS